MDRIISLIYEKSLNGEILSLDEVALMSEIIVKERELEEYVKDFYFTNSKWFKSLAAYDPVTRYILFSPSNVVSDLRYFNENIVNFNYYDRILYINITLLHIVLHEIEHASQKKMMENSKDFESLMLKFASLVKPEYQYDLYAQSISERLAETKTYDEIKKYLEILSIENLDKLIDIVESEKLAILLDGYLYREGELNIPFKDYFILGKREDILEDVEEIINDTKSLPHEQRFKYGLHITDEEYHKAKRLNLYLKKNFRR